MRVLLFTLAAAAAFADGRHDFEMKVRPVFAKNCWGCHRTSAMGGLRLDSREAVLKGGKSGPAAIPSKAAESLLISAITHSHEKLKMPPTGKLSDNDIAALKEWVDGGLYWPEGATPVIAPEQRAFWSLQPLKQPAPGASVDKFIDERIAAEGLKPNGPADRRTLMRRASHVLHGLPATYDEVEAFAADKSPNAWAKVVDRLLASPRYGERWGRIWLDVARYSDDRFNSTEDEPYPNSWRYRNWVIDALNQDMSYDHFVKAQLAGDLLPTPEKYAAATGFYAMSPEMQDDRVDATTRGFLGMTVACAQCHDHKFDPIPQQDYYSLQGVFASTHAREWPLADKATVDTWNAAKKRVDDLQAAIDRFNDRQREDLAQILAAQTERYMLAVAALGPADGLDEETLKRWRTYLAEPKKDHPFLKSWFDARTDDERRKTAHEFQSLVIEVNAAKVRVDDRNRLILGVDPDRGKVAGATLESLPRDRYILWRDLFERPIKDSAGFFESPTGVYYYAKKSIKRWLGEGAKAYLDARETELAEMKKGLPPKFPFLHTLAENDKPADVPLLIRGDRNNPGEIAPRRFLAALSPDKRELFRTGSGRLELANAIVAHPITARVIANRLWQGHFGRGIVGTASNFGQMGDRPTHPELLDYLAQRLIDSGWSLKALHREIMLSAVWARSAADNQSNSKDADNKLLWRANRRRLDAESLRDGMLAATGTLDLNPAEKAAKLDDAENRKRTVYGFISRRKLDGMLALFDFPNPNNTSESRLTTNVPLQRLFLMNSEFVSRQAEALAANTPGDGEAFIADTFRRVFARQPDPAELRAGVKYLSTADKVSYCRVLLGANEFLWVE